MHRQLIHRDYIPSDKKYPLSFLLDGVKDPLNTGAAFRLADALGAERIYLAGETPVPPRRDIAKTARSTEKIIVWEYHHSIREAAEAVKKAGYSLICLELTDHSIPLADFNFTSFPALCLLAGSETAGVSQEALDNADAVIHIPMRGRNSSMNLVSALAIAAYEASLFLPLR